MKCHRCRGNGWVNVPEGLELGDNRIKCACCRGKGEELYRPTNKYFWADNIKDAIDRIPVKRFGIFDRDNYIRRVDAYNAVDKGIGGYD